MSLLFEAGRELQNSLETRGWRFCFIGGLAVLRWGEPRFTRDIDVTLLCPFGSEDSISIPLLDAGYLARISEVREFARRNRVLLLQTPNGIPVDIALGALPFEERMIERSTLFEFEPGSVLRTCSAEDLVILKLFAFRARDLADAETVAIRHSAALDWDYIRANLDSLAEVKGEPGIMAALEKLRKG